MNSSAEETDRNRSAQGFGDYAVVDTAVQVESWMIKSPNTTYNATLLSGIREVAECLEQPLYPGER